MKTNIIVTLQVEGQHCWPKAKEIFPKMGFLSDPHRHIFHIVVKKKVDHADRDIEIIDFKREIVGYFNRNYYKSTLEMHDFEHRSCEMLAKDLIEAYDLTYCSVLEDNENGAEVYAD